jgi:hypothetical protein
MLISRRERLNVIGEEVVVESDSKRREHVSHVEVFTSKEPLKRVAHIISEVANPLVIAFPTFLLISLCTAPDVLHGFFWWIITFLGISVAPFLFILQGVQRGKYTDRHVSMREQRLVPLLFGLVSVVVVFLLLLLLKASLPLIATLTAVIVALAIATVITKFWKISFHLVGVAGAVTACTLVLGPSFLLLSPLIVLVAWARWEVRAHTPLQAVAGTVLAVSVTMLVFAAFHLI